MKKLQIETLKKLLNYLASKPWAEVNELIVELSKTENVETNKK